MFQICKYKYGEGFKALPAYAQGHVASQIESCSYRHGEDRMCTSGNTEHVLACSNNLYYPELR